MARLCNLDRTQPAPERPDALERVGSPHHGNGQMARQGRAPSARAGATLAVTCGARASDRIGKGGISHVAAGVSEKPSEGNQSA
jgi:hypothetical protein